MGRVVLAMSGGVDSSVAACLLREQGHEVIGLFMRTGVEAPDYDQGGRKQGCCSITDAGDARRVADRLGIPFYALDFSSEFGRVIDYFADEYLAGRTPNPCVMCNNWLKFGQLWSYGRQLGADFIATGHYARIVRGQSGIELHRGIDPGQDQSYVLAGLRPAVLEHVLFPVGGLTKDEVRARAREAGLAVSDKPDSVEICFVPQGDHAAVIRERRPGVSRPGRFVDRSGQVLGQHEGIEKYTVGQRKGLGIAAGERRYVLEIDSQTRDVVLGRPEDLLSPGLEAARVNWLLARPPATPLCCDVKIRYRHAPCPALVTPGPDGTARVEFSVLQGSVTPGQAVVFYEGTRILGGGWIERGLKASGSAPGS